MIHPLSTPPSHFFQPSLFQAPRQTIEPQEIGVTPCIRTLFATLDERLPADFAKVIDQEDSLVFVAELNAHGLPVKVNAYRSYPALGERSPVDVGLDWGVRNLVWFRKRPLYCAASFSRVKYECLISYTEDYRPQFEVDFTAPLFSLTLLAN